VLGGSGREVDCGVVVEELLEQILADLVLPPLDGPGEDLAQLVSRALDQGLPLAPLFVYS
jgi:hypothetical protein